jgi:hypothetical protein
MRVISFTGTPGEGGLLLHSANEEAGPYQDGDADRDLHGEQRGAQREP